MSKDALNAEDIESKQFREALLTRLNGQSEDLQRVIKLTDTRFSTMSRRMREHQQMHREQQQSLVRLVVVAVVSASGIGVGGLKAVDLGVAIVEAIR